MRRMFATLWTLGSLTAAVPAWSLGETANASRLARQAMDAAQRSAGQKAFIATADAAPVFELRVGLARDRAEDGTRLLLAPLELSYQPTRKSPWTLRVSGAAYTRITSPGLSTADGLADVSFEVERSLHESMSAVLGVTVPAGGEVGSTTASQYLALLRWGDLGQSWSYLWLAGVERSNRRDEGLGRTAQSLYGELDYAMGGEHTLIFSAARWHQRGAGGVTDLGLGYRLQVSSSTSATVSVTRGITRDARHTGVGARIKYSF